MDSRERNRFGMEVNIVLRLNEIKNKNGAKAERKIYLLVKGKYTQKSALFYF
jgi:hypothetical protein